MIAHLENSTCPLVQKDAFRTENMTLSNQRGTSLHVLSMHCLFNTEASHLQISGRCSFQQQIMVDTVYC
jgi:hypothetical protein